MRVQILDVTLRDGGYLNGFSFSIEEGCAIARAAHEARVPGVEIGYFIPRQTTPDDLGRKGYSLDYIEQVSACCHPDAQSVVMIPPGAALASDYIDLAERGVDVVRFPLSRPKLAQVAIDIEAARKAGLKVSVNLIRVSEYSLNELVELGCLAASLNPDWLYLADSNGALFPDQVKAAFAELRARIDIPLGFHPHDGLSLAFANSLQALNEGASMLDASVGGLGKGGGNLALEIIALYLNSVDQANFDCNPMLEAAKAHLMLWLGDKWPKQLKEALASIINLNQQAVINMHAECGGDTWASVDQLLKSFETKFANQLSARAS